MGHCLYATDLIKILTAHERRACVIRRFVSIDSLKKLFRISRCIVSDDFFREACVDIIYMFF